MPVPARWVCGAGKEHRSWWWGAGSGQVGGREAAAMRQRALLALEVGRIVGHEQLIGGLYPRPPVGAVAAVHTAPADLGGGGAAPQMRGTARTRVRV
ncbi:hypothetical protein AB0A63_22545 [Lentzea sp. NPDC042327]|uniref:hypothetical protein n=1 Tax=Lentzea sp. NPDC042327 TaxID=3154801 RepID=UPI0033F30560